jgi:hypothetical protein
MKGLRRNRGSIGVTIAGIQIILIILINPAHHGSKYFASSFHRQYVLMFSCSVLVLSR